MIRTQPPPYVASPWGQRFHSLTVHEALGGGAAGGGKTVCLAHEPLAQILVEHERCANPDFIPPGHREPQPLLWGESKGLALFLRRVTPMLRHVKGLAIRSYPRIDPKVRWNEKDQEFTFQSGYKVRFGHCKDRDDWNAYWGDEITLLLLDELTQFTKMQYEQIGIRVRTDDPVLSGMTKMRAMSNPEQDTEGMEGVALDEDPYWVRKMFVDPWPKGERLLWRNVELSDGTTARWSRCYMPAKLRDNPNQKFARDYDLKLSSLPPHRRKALRDGDWYVNAGSFFASVWDEKCVIEPYEIPPDFPVFRSMDWGFRKPGCIHWWVLDEDDVLICIREQLFVELSPEEVAKMIRVIEEGMGIWRRREGTRKGDRWSPITGPADTQIWEERDGSVTIADEMATHGVGWVPADKKSRQRNAMHLFGRLKDRVAGQPAIKFFQGRCPKAVEIIPSIGTSHKNKNEPADGGFDHPYDSVSYACAHAVRGRLGIGGARREEDYDEDELPTKSRSKRGQWGYGY